MINHSSIAYTTIGDSLTYEDLTRVCNLLRNGGVAIVPSDTCMSIAVYPFRRDSLARLTQLMPSKTVDPIPLAFDSRETAEIYADLTAADERLADRFWPGPLTLVCAINDRHDKHAISEILHTSGTIGSRVPDSPVERQISSYLRRPITTCAVRSAFGEPIRSFDDAIDLVRDRINMTGESFPVAAVRTAHSKYDDVSTVVSVREEFISPEDDAVMLRAVHIYREGVLTRGQINRALRTLSASDCVDFT